MKAKIQAISYYLPEQVLTNEDLVSEFPEWSVEKIVSKIGILQRHISGKDELSSDMAVKAANKLFEEHHIKPESIEFVILCTQSPDFFLPTTACTIQDRLGISTKAGAIDFNLGCSGFIYGLAIAKGLILAGIVSNVLLLTSETYTKFIHPSDKGNRAIFGDAAAATLISSEGFASIENFDLGTDGKGAGNLIVRNGALRNRTTGNKLESGEISSDNLFMNGGEIFNFTLESVPKIVANVLDKNSLQKSEVDLYIFHQANKFMLNHLRKKLAIPDEIFYYHLENIGNTVSSTIPIAIYEAMKESKIKKSNKVLLAGFGVGYSWGGTILAF
jgi:3-oxoacyl-[acyl-carrier-protein] synthase-3